MKDFKVTCFDTQLLLVLEIQGYSHRGSEKTFGERTCYDVYFKAASKVKLQAAVKAALRNDKQDGFLQGFNVVRYADQIGLRLRGREYTTLMGDKI